MSSRLLALEGLLLVVAVLPVAGAEPRPATPVCSYSVVNTYPHDQLAFTQGLIYREGFLYESTGLLGHSTLRQVDLSTGSVLQSHSLPGNRFGEGLSWREGDQLVQLSWHAGTAYVYARGDFSSQGTLSYPGEGWGLTNDGTRLVMSDGSATLDYRDSTTFDLLWTLDVFDNAGPVSLLNELEAVAGELFANVWFSDRIARIDPASGEVIAWIDLSGLLDPPDAQADVLNGIAYDAASRRLFVTGKLWHSLYEIEMVGCPPLLLFGDGFEHGGAARWSEVVSAEQRP